MTEDSTRRVLHIEDSPRMRASLEVVVSAADGLTLVGAAADGVEGVEMARSLHPDVIVLDQQMPRLDGLEALPLLREACPDAVVVMWSNDPGVRDEAMARGAADVVDKAAPLTTLLDALRPRPASPGS